jgi:hypothetical protein
MGSRSGQKPVIIDNRGGEENNASKCKQKYRHRSRMRPVAIRSPPPITPSLFAWRTQLAKLFEYVINKIIMSHAENIPFAVIINIHIIASQTIQTPMPYPSRDRLSLTRR